MFIVECTWLSIAYKLEKIKKYIKVWLCDRVS